MAKQITELNAAAALTGAELAWVEQGGLPTKATTQAIADLAAGAYTLTILDEGTPLATGAISLDFVGAGVVASGTGSAKTITIAGGSGVSELIDLSDVNTSTATNRFVLVADGVDYESRLLVEADISNLGAYHLAATALVGDVTGTVGATTIAADVITYTKMQNVVADERLLGNIAGAGGIVTELTPTQVRTMINVEDGSTADQTSIVGITGTMAQFDTAITDGNAAYAGGAFHDGFSDFVANEHIDWTGASAGTIHATNYTDTVYTHPNHSGDVTSVADGAQTIAAGVVTLAKMADMATSSLIYRKTAATGAPEVNTLATLKTDLGLTGSNSGDQTITLTTDVTGTGTGSFAATIAADAVTYAKMQNVVANNVFLGNNAGAGGIVDELTATEATALLNTFATAATTKGLVPGSNSAGSSMYLNADGGWTAPPGGAASDSFKTMTIDDTDTEYTWAALGSAVADGSADTLTWVSGVGIDIDVDATLDAIRITYVNDAGYTTNAGTVTSVSGAGTVSGLTLTGSVSSSGDLTLGGAITGFATGSGSASGSNTGDQTITLTGNVTGTGTGSFATTIAANSVTLARMADMATASFLGRNTAATGDPEVLSVATAKTMLNLTGTNSGDQTITLTGNVTGTGTGSFAATIAAGVVTNAKLSTMAANTVKANATAGVATPTNLAVGANTVLGRVAGNIVAAQLATGQVANSAVTLAKMANVATGTVFYRKTAATGVPEVQTLATLKTDLGLTGTNSGDSGTVTSVSVVTANGVSGSVATATTTPAITLTLGAITPTSVGGITSANLVDKTATESITGAWTYEAASGNTNLNVQKAALADQATVTFNNEGGVTRWIFGEAGGTDDDFFLGRYNDAAAWQGSALYVDGITGQVDLRFASDATKLSVVTGGVNITGLMASTTISGSGAAITALDADNVSAGTLAVLRGGTGVTTKTGTGSVVLSASPTFTGITNFADSEVDRARMSDFAIKHQVVSGVASTTIDYETGQSVLLNMTANITTLTLSNWPLTSWLGQLEIEIAQDTTARTITWPAAVTWLNGAAPDLSTISETYIVHLSTRDGGTTVQGSYPADSSNIFGSGADFNDQVVTGAHLDDYSILHQDVTGIASTTINYSSGQSVNLQLGAANVTTLTLSNWPATGRKGVLEILVTQGGTARTVAWPTEVNWPGGTAPDLATANGRFLIYLTTVDAGVTHIDGTFTEALS